MEKEKEDKKRWGGEEYGEGEEEGGGGVRQHEVGYPYPPKTGWELSLDP